MLRSEADWVTVRTSVATVVDDSLGGLSRFSLGRMRFAIARPPLDTLHASWLRIPVLSERPGASDQMAPPVSTSYATSQLFIFSVGSLSDHAHRERGLVS